MHAAATSALDPIRVSISPDLYSMLMPTILIEMKIIQSRNEAWTVIDYMNQWDHSGSNEILSTNALCC